MSRPITYTAATLEEAYRIAVERYNATGIPQEVGTVMAERRIDTLLGVPVLDHYTITDKPQEDQ